MLIQVIRADNHYDYVKDFILDSLIESKGIVKFKRSTGWVTIGADPMRKSTRSGAFNGTDRRTTDNSI
jgi:hypothetical protein